MYWTENMWGSDDINIIQHFLSPCGGERERENIMVWTDRIGGSCNTPLFYYLFRPQFHMLFKISSQDEVNLFYLTLFQQNNKSNWPDHLIHQNQKGRLVLSEQLQSIVVNFCHVNYNTLRKDNRSIILFSPFFIFVSKV